MIALVAKNCIKFMQTIGKMLILKYKIKLTFREGILCELI